MEDLLVFYRCFCTEYNMKPYAFTDEIHRSLHDLLDLLHKVGINTRPLPVVRIYWDPDANGGQGGEFFELIPFNHS